MRVAVIGECMVEFYSNNNTEYYQSFAGDTFNTAYYLKQINPKLEVEFISVVGNDVLSKAMLDFFHIHGINTNYIDTLENKTVGLYMIHTLNGERSFSYWRDNSAAKELFTTSNLTKLKNELKTFDLIYFSAITLAIMSKNGRKNFFKIIKDLRKNGVIVAYDSNYRQKLYEYKNDALNQNKQALKNCDIYLPSMEDERSKQNTLKSKNLIKKAINFGVNEIVIKNGDKNIIYCSNGKIHKYKINSLKNVVDTTAAGDSFNGAYLASRLKQKSIENAIRIASKTAKKVIMSKGAIIDLKE